MEEENKLLLSAIDIKGEVSTEKLDWEYLFSMAKLNKIFVPFYLKNRVLMPENVIHKFDIQYREYVENAERQKSEMTKISQLLIKENVDNVVIKGIPLSYSLYDRVDYRQSSDIDILVYEQDMDLAFSLLMQQGYGFNGGMDYETNEMQIEYKPKLYYARDYFEYPCVKCMGVSKYSFVEIKKASSAIQISHIKNFIKNSNRIIIDGYEINTLDREYTCLHLFSNFYENIKSNRAIRKGCFLREFYDIYAFAKKNIDIDWSMILCKAKEYNMVHKIYFAMNLCNELYRNEIFNSDIVDTFSANNYKWSEDENRQFIYHWRGDIYKNIFDAEFRMRQFHALYKDYLFRFIEEEKLDIKERSIWKNLIFGYEGDKIVFRYRIYYNFDNTFSMEIEDCNELLRNKNGNMFLELFQFDDEITSEITIGENYFLESKIECECYKEKDTNRIWKIRVLNEVERFYLKFEIRIKVGMEGFCRISPQKEYIYLKKI